MPITANNLDEYLNAYGPLMARQTKESLNPLFDPDKDPLHPKIDQLLRALYPAQANAVTAGVAAFDENKGLMLVGEAGTGKTTMGPAIAHCHAKGEGYRVLVMSPPHLASKWPREVEAVIPGAVCITIESLQDLNYFWENRNVKPNCPEYYFVGREKAKLGSGWQTSGMLRKTIVYEDMFNDEGKHIGRSPRLTPYLVCPACGGVEWEADKKGVRLWPALKTANYDSSERRAFDYATHKCQPAIDKRKKLISPTEVLIANRGDEEEDKYGTDGLCKKKIRKERRKNSCHLCGEALWQWIPEPRRWAPADFISKKLKGYFDYFLADEVHEQKGITTATGNALGSLAAACKHTIVMTGTIVGGSAEHIRPLLYRIAPTTIVEEGFKWAEPSDFSKKYGRIETTVTTTWKAKDNLNSKGKRSVHPRVRPGIMPTLFGRHLIDKAIFVSLESMSDQLPNYEEIVVGCQMSDTMKLAYKQMEQDFKDAISDLFRAKGVAGIQLLLGTMTLGLVCYPDLPFGWEGFLGYQDKGFFVPVTKPMNLASAEDFEKEIQLLEIIKKEKSEGRKVWVYATYNGKKDVQQRIVDVCEKAGFSVASLRSTVQTGKREEWIAKNAPNADVIVSHPKLVETGLDFFDKAGTYNVPSIVFYQCGYNAFTLRQASRRAYRLGQAEHCRVYFLFYEGTLQERMLTLMGSKMQASLSMEGKFTTEGLVSMSDDDGAEVALARTLMSSSEVREPMMRSITIRSNEPQQRELEFLDIDPTFDYDSVDWDAVMAGCQGILLNAGQETC